MSASARRFSDYLEIWPGTSVRRHFEHAAELVDKVHRVEIPLPGVWKERIQCCDQMPPREEGKPYAACEARVFFNEDQAPWLIYLNPEAVQPLLTVTHEFGHVMSYAISRAGLTARKGVVEKRTELYGWLRTNSVTDRIRQMVPGADDREVKAAIREWLTGSSLPPLPMPLKHYLEYLASDEELFARSYAQWISTKTRAPDIENDLLFWLEDKMYDRIPEQWQRSEFLPGETGYDALFLELGWLIR